MNNIKKIIIAIVVIIVILIILLMIGMSQKNNQTPKTPTEQEIKKDPQSQKIEEVTQITPVTSRNDFYSIVDCVNSYINYLSKGDTEKLLILLDEQYQKQQNITKENMETKLQNYKTDFTFKPTEMYYIQDPTTRVDTYYVQGKKIGISLDFANIDNSTPYYIIIKLNRINQTFTVIPEEFEVKKLDNNKIDITLKNEKQDSNTQNNNTQTNKENNHDEEGNNVQ